MERGGKLTTYAGVLALVLLACVSVRPAAADDLQDLVDSAKETFDSFVSDPSMKGFHENLKEAKGVVIFPQVFKAAFIFGVQGGTGVLVARDPKKGWSDPAFYLIASGSFGVQIGVEGMEMILLVMTQTGVDALLTSSFKLGVDAGVAAGPVGKGGTARVDILAYARAIGIYAGVSADGSVISTRDKSNSEYYGKPDVKAIDILVKRDVHNEKAAPLVKAVAKAAK